MAYDASEPRVHNAPVTKCPSTAIAIGGLHKQETRFRPALVALFPIHNVELVPGPEDDCSMRDFLGAHLRDLLGRRFALSQLQLESAFFHVDAVTVSKLCQACRCALHILRHPERRTRAGHSPLLADCSCRGTGKCNRGTAADQQTRF